MFWPVGPRPGRHIPGVAVETDVLHGGAAMDLREVGLEDAIAILDRSVRGEVGGHSLANLAEHIGLVDPGQPAIAENDLAIDHDELDRRAVLEIDEVTTDVIERREG